jgi:hypothetical protein
MMISKRNTLSEPARSSMELAEPFDVFVIATVDTLGYLCGISMHDLYLDAEACITAYTEGVRRLDSMFDERIPLIVPYTTPVIKYGHLNTLGIPLLFPETGQVALDMHPMGLEQVMALLETGKKRSFSSELTDVQLEYLKKMRTRFPDKRVHWGWQWEGPLTTLWALAGVESMYAVHDDPSLFKRCMHLVTQSIVEYSRFYCRIDGTEVLDPFPDHGRLCDDIAAMYSPDMWPEMVLPFWRQFYQAPVPAVKLHCEDMHPDHLPLLKGLGITDYDPGISPRLNPSIISRHPWLPFCWRLGSFHYQDMSLAGIHDFVFSAAGDGAGYVFTVMEPLMCTDETVKKVEHLYESGREVVKLLEKGHSSTDLLGMLEGTYPSGYWKSWNGYRFS